MNVSICVPARDEVATGFAHDLAMLSARWYGNAPPGVRFDVHIVNGTLIADQRAKLAHMALTAGADYVLYLDSDMRFPSYLLEKLIAHDKDIVACNYATRRLPVKTVAFKDWSGLDYVYSLGKSGLEQVAAVGMGAMLIRADVFKKLGYPWFQIHYLPSAKMWAGEDMFFCELARKAGFDIWIDHDTSQWIGHTGSLDFHHNHTEDEMDAQNAKKEAAE